jgi:hypothetical protein
MTALAKKAGHPFDLERLETAGLEAATAIGRSSALSQNFRRQTRS